MAYWRWFLVVGLEDAIVLRFVLLSEVVARVDGHIEIKRSMVAL